MVIKAEQERVRTLIADTVSLLCKNGLHYSKEFSIDGLLGITLDRDEVFLVNIREIVKTDDGKEESDSDVSGDDGSVNSPASPSKRRKRRRSKSKQTAEGDIDDTSNDTSTSALPDNCEPPEKKINVKEEYQGDSDEDLVFIKDEPGSADLSTCSFSEPNFSGAQSNNILGDMSQHGSLYATPTSLPGATSWDASQAASFSQSLPSQPTGNTPGQQIGTFPVNTSLPPPVLAVVRQRSGSRNSIKQFAQSCMRALFTKQERLSDCNVIGSHGKRPLSPTGRRFNMILHATAQEFGQEAHNIRSEVKTAINASIRHSRYNAKRGPRWPNASSTVPNLQFDSHHSN